MSPLGHLAGHGNRCSWLSAHWKPPLMGMSDKCRFFGSRLTMWPVPRVTEDLIERNAVALLSNYAKAAVDPPSQVWLGKDCTRERVRLFGMWNSNHVDEQYDPRFLNVLVRHVKRMSR